VLLACFKIAGRSGATGGTTPWIIPLGFSYLAFELLHVILDRRRGRIAAIAFLDLLAYALFLPCRIAGPIRRLPEFTAAVARARISAGDIYAGVLRILIGLGKKLVLADTLALTGAELGNIGGRAHAGRSCSPIRSASISISAPIPIWRSGSRVCSGSAFRRTSRFRISR
jgi:hypothetical protein